MIGIFDSGLGGLTAYRELHTLLPDEHYVYFGDTGRVPYGSRSHEILLKYTRQDINFLISKGADAILAACGTVSSVVLDEVKGEYNVPIIGVVDASSAEALAATKNGIIGVIGTGATVSSGAFEKKLKAGGADEVVSVACPLFVPLVENGYIARDCEVTKLVARDYLEKIKASGADTLILGCTHFPIIADIIADELPNVTLINSGAAAAKAVAKTVSTAGGNKSEFYVSDSPVNFDAVARIFLGGDTVAAKKIDIEKY
ncbi:MAG: glutamate racemase [Clostridia bacterium]|nr:glutamate racemase [Clostridia bacterium]